MNASSDDPDTAPVAVADVHYFPRASEVAARARAGPAGGWLWHGYLKRGHVTLLTSFWKSGKTTLVSVLLSRLAAGGTLAGQPVSAGRAVVLTEEPDDLWAERVERLGLGDHVRIRCRPFVAQPTAAEWDGLVDALLVVRDRDGLDLVVLDPLAHFLPGRSENDAVGMLAMFRTLRRLADVGLCVLVLHHPRKNASAPGRSARGSGALAGAVDIILEMDAMGRGADDDRRRRLWAFSRHTESPRRLVVELNPDGTDYTALGDFLTNEFDDGWPVLFGVLDDATHRLSRKEIREQWPGDYVKPDEVTLWRWLDRAVKDGRVGRAGTGRRFDPFRYWLPAKAEQWANDPMHPYSMEPLPELPALSEALGLSRRGGGS